MKKLRLASAGIFECVKISRMMREIHAQKGSDCVYFKVFDGFLPKKAVARIMR